ncbi:MAG TPA: condensation domain-containing protein, partial [Longimicrobiaceae bacterium]|nr:condensation domain-containing protein [Longimicrobiaceae bacterium]
AARIRAAMRVDVPVGVFFAFPTVEGLAAWIAGEGAPGEADDPSVLGPADRSRPIPLSAEQERLWFLSYVGDTESSYTVSKGLRLEGIEIDLGRLARSFSIVVERHEALRTVFPAVEGQGRQHVLPPAPFVLPSVDLRAVPARERPAETRRVAGLEAVRPFDLERGPLFRALVVRTGDTEYVLLTNLHHIVTDAWSTGILVQELMECYQALSTGREPVLPRLPVQYADYAGWQRRWLESPAADEQLRYWKRQLAGLPALDLCPDRARPARVSYRGGSLRMQLSAELSARLRALAERERVTLFMLLLAGFKVVLAHYSRQRDVVVGIDAANRRTVELERLIGFFINELVLRSDLSGDPAFTALLGRVRDVTLGAYQNQDLPFGLLVKELVGRRDLGTNPLFQVMFGLKNAPRPDVALDGLRVHPVEVASEVAVFELCLYMEETPREIFGLFTYRTDLFDAATIEAMRSDLVEVLERVSEHPGVGVEELVGNLGVRERERRAERTRIAEQAGRRMLKSVQRKAIPITSPPE